MYYYIKRGNGFAVRHISTAVPVLEFDRLSDIPTANIRKFSPTALGQQEVSQ